MSTEAQVVRSMDSGRELLQKNKGLLLFMGIVLIILGTMAITLPFIAGLASVLYIGAFLVVGGLFQLVHSFVCREWRGFFLSLLAGVLYLVLGAMFLRHPYAALEVLTVMIAVVLMISGLFRIIATVTLRFEKWGWTLLGGAIALGLGILIWDRLPWSGLWLVGTYVGIDMIFTGWSYIMLRSAARKTSKEA